MHLNVRRIFYFRQIIYFNIKFVSGKKNKLSIFGDYLQKKNDTYIIDFIHMMFMLMLI